MAYNGHSVVDLTDDRDGNGGSPGPSSSALPRNGSQANAGGNGYLQTQYMSSPTNPAKRSRIDPSNMTPLALLNPKAFMANGSNASRKQTSQASSIGDPPTLSLNNRMEVLHGLKDRKVASPSSAKMSKRAVSESGERRSASDLVSRNAISKPHTPELIDLTSMMSL